MTIKEQIVKLFKQGLIGYQITKKVYKNPTAGNYQYVYKIIRELKEAQERKQL